MISEEVNTVVLEKHYGRTSNLVSIVEVTMEMQVGSGPKKKGRRKPAAREKHLALKLTYSVP